MADAIEQLNFKVILQDDDFKATVDSDLQLAEKLNTKLSEIFKIHSQSKPKQLIADKGVTNAKQMLDYISQMEQKIESMSGKKLLVGDVDALNQTLKQVLANLDKIVAKEKEHRGAVQGTNSALLRTKSVLSTLTQLTGVVFGVAGLRQFLSTLMEVTGQFEVQKMALRTILQDIDGADKIFQDLYRFSSDSTYRFSELAKYAKQLAAFNIGKNDLLETTKMLGDVASGVGASMDRVILAYGHVKTSGFLRGIQLRSFSQNGIPVLDELAKILSEVENKAISLGDVFDKMTKREIPFEMVEQAFKNMTSEGGKFYKMQETLAKTLAGQMNILKGRWENLLYAIGQANDGILKGAVGKISNLVADYDAFGKKIKELIVLFGTFQVSLGVTALAMGKLGEAGTGLFGALVRLGQKVLANPYVALAATITAAAYAIYEFRTQLTSVEKITTTVYSTIEQFNRQLGAETAAFDALYDKLKLAEEGTVEYDNAKKAIMSRYGDYINQLRSEGTEVSDLIGIYDALKTKIEAANRARFRDTATTNLEKTYNQQVDDFYEHLFNQPLISADSDYKLKKLVSSIKGINAGAVFGKAEDYFTGLQKEAIWQLVTGGISEEQLRQKAEKYEELSPILAAIPTINEIKSEFSQITDAYADGMEKFNDLFKEEGGDNDKKEHKPLDGWRKTVQDTLYKLDQSFERTFMPEENEDYFEYLDKVGKRYKEVSEQKYHALEQDKHIYQQELDAIKAIDKALEGNILSDARYRTTPWLGSSGSGKDPLADERKRIKTDIAQLEKYKAAYDAIEPFLGEETAAKLNSFDYYKNVDFSTLDEKISGLIEELRGLGDEGKEAAETIEARLGYDVVSKLKKQYTEAEKALKEYEAALAKFDKDWGTGQTGITGKFESAIRAYNNENTEIEKDYIKLKEKAAKANKDEAESWDRLYKARKKANEAKLKDAITGLADDIFKEAMQGEHLADWSDKTLSDIIRIKEKVESLKVPDEIQSLLSTMPGVLAIITAQLDKVKQAFLGNTIDPEAIKKWVKYGKQVASYIDKAADAMERLGEATGNAGLSDAAKNLSAVGKTLSAAAEGYSKSSGSWIGAVVGGVLEIITQITDAVSESNAKLREMENTIRNIRTEIDKSHFDNLLSDGADGVFGENALKKINNAAKGLDDVRVKIGDLGGAYEEYLKKLRVQEFKSPSGPWGKPNVGILKTIEEQLESPDIEKLPIKTKESWRHGDTYQSLSEIAKELGMELYDIYGNLNPELLNHILTAYGDLNEGAKDWLTSAATYSEEYAKAMGQVYAVMEDLFGDIASSAADKIIDQWVEAGDAALDYADILDDVAKKYAKMLLQSAILYKVLNEEEANKIADMFLNGRTDEAMAAIADDMEKIADMEPLFNQIMTAVDPYLNKAESSSGSGSIGSGIKSITEDTANLLASYINAIRADVSMIRMMQEKGWSSMEALGNAIPTLNDYLNQVAANTLDTAQNTQSILTELRSVIGSQGSSGMVVRVERV